VKTKGFEKKY